MTLEDNTIDFAISGLVLNFIPDPAKALQEMQRVTCPGGTIAVYIWDYSGKMEFLKYYWDAVEDLDSKASALHEGTRFPDSTKEGMRVLFENAGFPEVKVEPIEIETNFESFDDFWKTFPLSRQWGPLLSFDLGPKGYITRTKEI